jgi:AcrR family transcriptional regulator
MLEAGKRAIPRPKRRVGRPRANGTVPTLDPREHILRVSAKLFAERGFQGVSTRQIANAVGLRQSALFHWFPSKEALLEELFSRGWDRSLAYVSRVASLDLPGAVKLSMCLGYDARLVAGAEPHFQVMIVPPELRQPRFSGLLQKRQQLIDHLAVFIQQGIDEGDFRRLDPRELARMVLAVDEVILDPARGQRSASPTQHAEHVVDFALHALVVDTSRVAKILASITSGALE